MKIHNYGSDYAYQQKLKKEASGTSMLRPIVKLELNPTDDVEHQIQTGGEATVAAADKGDGGTSDSTKIPETNRHFKKKKKNNGSL